MKSFNTVHGSFNLPKVLARVIHAGRLVKWAADARLPGVAIWAEPRSKESILYIRIDDVDFSFHAVPGSHAFLEAGNNALTWSGMRLKPIAPIVLARARGVRSPDTARAG
jgi:hypothetical protein